jgi:hypothetical protein
MIARSFQKRFWPLWGFSLLAVCLLLCACSSDTTTSVTNPRSITVSIKNLENNRSVHVYFNQGEPSEENLVSPRGEIITQISVQNIGQSVTVHVAEGDKAVSIPFYSRDVRVTQTSWDSRQAELHWTGSSITPVGW